jgi:hypothetical protein
MGRLAVVLVAVLCVGMAGGVYVLSIHQPTQTVERAETVTGTVTATSIDSQSTDSGATYAPVVTYEYRFDGATYTSTQIELVGSVGFQSPGGAEAFLQSYAAGDTVTVHVDPRNPTTAFLQRGSVGFLIYGVIGFLGFVGVLSVIALVGDVLGVGAIDIKE